MTLPEQLEAAEAGSRELDRSTFKLRRFDISVSGFSEPMTSTVLATSRGKALADTWRNDIFNGYSFGKFLKMARCRLSTHQPAPDQITVSGEPMWGLGHDGQYVSIVHPNGEHVLYSHPLDVEPESYRPAYYRSAAIKARGDG